MATAKTTPSRSTGDVEEIADALLFASRALLGIAVRSIAAIEDDVTLVQFRVLVLLTSRGDQNVSELAEAVGVHPSTATRLCDRLVAKKLVHRATSSESRREVTLTITARGRSIVRSVNARRRKEMVRVVEKLPRTQRQQLSAAFATFAAAAGEVALPEEAWKLGWTT